MDGNLAQLTQQLARMTADHAASQGQVRVLSVVSVGVEPG